MHSFIETPTLSVEQFDAIFGTSRGLTAKQLAEEIIPSGPDQELRNALRLDANQELHLHVAFDRSGSLVFNQTLNDAQEELALTLSTFEENGHTEVAITGYDGFHDGRLNLYPVKEARQPVSIATLRGSGGKSTPTKAVIEHITDQLRGKSGVKVLFIFIDGSADENSACMNAVNAARSQGIIVFSVFCSPGCSDFGSIKSIINKELGNDVAFLGDPSLAYDALIEHLNQTN